METQDTVRPSNAKNLEQIDQMIFANIARNLEVTQARLKEEFEAPKTSKKFWPTETFSMSDNATQKAKVSGFK
jgi:hypothetical protein